MNTPRLWPAPASVGGLVDFAYALTVGPSGHAVLPDARAGLVWLSDGTVRVCGPQTRPWRASRHGVDVTGVRLSLGAVPSVFGMPAAELVDRRVPLGDIWGQDAAQALALRMRDTSGPDARVRLLIAAVSDYAATAPAPDPLVPVLSHRLREPRVRIALLAGQVGLSERQLRRRCETAFGYPPSVLARMLRLQRFIRLARRPSARADGLARLAQEAGYADQAHLSRDCRALTDQAPSDFLPAPLVAPAVAMADPSKTVPGARP